MPSQGIMRSGLSGKKLMKRTSRRPFTRRTSPGAMRPPLITMTIERPHTLPMRSSRRASEDEEVIGGVGAAVLVERIVAPVREGANLMAHGHEFVAKIHAHVVGTVEGQHDQPAHAESLAHPPGTPAAAP